MEAAVARLWRGRPWLGEGLGGGERVVAGVPITFRTEWPSPSLQEECRLELEPLQNSRERQLRPSLTFQLVTSRRNCQRVSRSTV